MSRVRGSLDIARPVQVVFDAVADQRNEPAYNPTMTEAMMVTEGPIGAGTQFAATVLVRGAPRLVTTRYTGFERPHRIDSRCVMYGATVEGHVQCDPSLVGTRFSWDWTITLAGPARFAGPLVGLIGRHQERTIWTGLKRYLENQSPPQPSKP